MTDQPQTEETMTDPPQTGSVTSKSGQVTARKIVTGIDIEGAASDDVLKTALAAMQQLRTGGVSGAQGVEAGEIITGFRYFKPEAPSREAFAAEVTALRQELAGLAAQPDSPAEVQGAVASLAEVVAETQKEQPLAKRVLNRLRETIEFISDTSQVLDAASKAGPLLLKALTIAAGLYQAAQTLF